MVMFAPFKGQKLKSNFADAYAKQGQLEQAAKKQENMVRAMNQIGAASLYGGVTEAAGVSPIGDYIRSIYKPAHSMGHTPGMGAQNPPLAEQQNAITNQYIDSPFQYAEGVKGSPPTPGPYQPTPTGYQLPVQDPNATFMSPANTPGMSPAPATPSSGTPEFLTSEIGSQAVGDVAANVATDAATDATTTALLEGGTTGATTGALTGGGAAGATTGATTTAGGTAAAGGGGMTAALSNPYLLGAMALYALLS